jgi:hypothetical protein
VPICHFAPSANGARDYNALAVEVEASDPNDADAGLTGDYDFEGEGLREVVVRFRDPAATDVRIAGDFNGWVPDKGVRSLIESDGPVRVWTKILKLSPGTYQYRYIVDGEWREGPEGPESTGIAATDSETEGNRKSVLVVR